MDKLNKINFFPLGIASGALFFNRKAEIRNLLNNIELCKHTLLISPRRYGKTSLALEAINRSKYPFIKMDLMTLTNANEFESRLFTCSKDLVRTVQGKSKKLFFMLTDFLEHSRKNIKIGYGAGSIELSPNREQSIAINIIDLFETLEHLLKDKNKKGIILLDEFQQISKLADSHILQAAIRSFAQGSKHLVFIFSGSHRHILKNMFHTYETPLYKLCDTIEVKRIPFNEYQNYIYISSQSRWKGVLNKKLIGIILNFTQCHTYDTNAFCSYLFSHFDQSPTEEMIKEKWKDYVEVNAREWTILFDLYNNRKLDVLKHIAKFNGENLTTAEAVEKSGLSSAIISQNIRILEQDDMIEKLEKGKYRIISPVLDYLLKK